MSTKSKTTPVPSEEFALDPPSVVGEDPLDAMRRRQHATLSALGQIRVELKEQTERDIREHAAINTSLATTCERLDDQAKKIDESNKLVTELRVATGKMEGTLTVLVDELRAKREVTVMHERAIIERDTTRERFKLEDEADENKTRRKSRLKILGIIGSVLGTGGIAATIATLAAGGC